MALYRSEGLSLRTAWEGVYFDGKTAERRPVRITVTGGGLHIVQENGAALWWPYEEILQTQGFHPGEPIRLERGGETPEAVVVADPAFLRVIHRVAPQTATRFRGPGSRSIRLPLTLATAAAILLLGGGLYVWAIPALADKAAAHVPQRWEEELGQAVMAQLAPVEKRCADPASLASLHQIATTLSATLPAARYRFEIIVVDDSTVNALAAPGGYILIFRGLLERTESPEEMAGILAHEMQHIVNRHGTRAILREISLRALATIVTGGSSGTDFALQAAGTLGGLRYQRRDEEEADRGGIQTIQAARINPMGMIALLRRLEKENPEGPRSLQYLSTHPATAARVEQLRRLAAQASYTPVLLLPADSWEAIAHVCSRRAPHPQ